MATKAPVITTKRRVRACVPMPATHSPYADVASVWDARFYRVLDLVSRLSLPCNASQGCVMAAVLFIDLHRPIFTWMERHECEPDPEMDI